MQEVIRHKFLELALLFFRGFRVSIAREIDKLPFVVDVEEVDQSGSAWLS